MIKYITLRFIVPALLAVGMVSCSTAVPMDSGFKSNRNARVAVVTAVAPKATVMQQGNQGLLDALINAARTSGAKDRLESYPSQAKLDEVGAATAKRLAGLGYKATLIKEHPPADYNHRFAKPGSSKPIPGLDSYLKGYDAALFISMPFVGQTQAVYSFIPLGSRTGAAVLDGSLLNLPDSKVLWRKEISFEPQATTPVKGDAKDMRAVFESINAAVAAESELFERSLFKQL